VTLVLPEHRSLGFVWTDAAETTLAHTEDTTGATWQQGFLRDPDGRLVTSAGPGTYVDGFVRAASGALVVTANESTPALYTFATLNNPALLWTNVAGVAAGTDVVLPVDATADGKRLFAVMAFRGSGSGFATPAGWTLLADQVRSTAGRLQVFERVAASEPANYTFVASNVSTQAGVIGALDQTSALQVAAQEGASSTSHVAPDATPGSAPSVVLRAAMYAIATDSATPGYTWGAGLTELEDISQSSGLGTGSQRLSVAVEDVDHPDTSAVGTETATAISAGTWAAATLIGRA
jgi:hypothetical protein